MQGKQCQNCVWYLGELVCRAYPKKIPDKYIEGVKKHNRVQPKQKGEYVFKEIKE